MGRILQSNATPAFVETEGLRLGTLGTIDATFAVEKVYKWQKAEPAQSVVVRTVDQQSACGFDEWARPNASERWLIFATYADRDIGASELLTGEALRGTLTAYLCSGTSPVSRVREAFEYLEGITPK